jgi:hypothetical protein
MMCALRGVAVLAFICASTAQIVVNRAETPATVTITNAGLAFAPAQTSPFSGNGTLTVSGVCTVSSDVEPPVDAPCQLPISALRSDQTLRKRRKLQGAATTTPTAAATARPSAAAAAASAQPTAAPSQPETEAPTAAPETAQPTAAPSPAPGRCSVLTLTIPSTPEQLNGLNVTMAEDLRLVRSHNASVHRYLQVAVANTLCVLILAHCSQVITAIRNGLIDEQLCSLNGPISGDAAPIAASLNALFANGELHSFNTAATASHFTL